jgi:endo-1,3(4)-beta-glucanase
MPWRILATALPLVAILALAVTGCVAAPGQPTLEKSGSVSPGAVFPEAVVAPLVAALPERTVKPLPAARLADGLMPPTNTWFSGLVFGEQSMPVFPLPLSFQLTDRGFAFGLPTVRTEPKLIMGSFNPAIEVDLGADRQVVTAYDVASVTITQYRGDLELGHVLIAQGSPFVTFTAASPTEVTVGEGFSAQPEDGVSTLTRAGETYGLVSGGSRSNDELALAPAQTATWFALGDGSALDDFVEAAAHPVLGTSLEFTPGTGGTDAAAAQTRIGYRTDGGANTLVAAMPHQYADGQPADDAAPTRCDRGDFRTVYGQMRLCSTAALEWGSEVVEPSGALDVSGLGDEQKATLAAQVTADVANSKDIPADTYFGGKALYRAANLWSIATQVGATDAALALKTTIITELDRWMEPDGCATRDHHCFVYDAEAKGVVGLVPSFGSEEFNDHHFHYGYFFYAAGVLAASEPELVAGWAPVMNLLAADIATHDSDSSEHFPVRRVFDAYAGHSWASGTSPFADGNNQESSSEAVGAWNGLALWAAASSQPELEAEARWMLAAEAGSAMAYWTDFDLDDPVYDGFEHSVTSLVWGGKREWATWFSPEPSAMLGILVLPLSPASGYLARDPDRVRANLRDAAPGGYDVLFGDYLLMYSALAGPDDARAALEASDSLNEDRIDDGNSRSYLLAYLMTLAR